MAGPVDEEFAERHLRSGSVLEFGCSPGRFTARIALARPDLDVTGIDLYPPEVTDGYDFVQGDVVEWDAGRTFDTIACVSSFEHCGIETANFRPGAAPNLDYHAWVAVKLAQLLAAAGRLIVTCPFGPDEVWFTREGGEDFRPGEGPMSEARWGYRTFSIDGLLDLFLGHRFDRLRFVLAEAWEHTGGDYFDRANWSPVDPERDAHRYTSPRRRAVMGVVFEKESPR